MIESFRALARREGGVLGIRRFLKEVDEKKHLWWRSVVHSSDMSFLKRFLGKREGGGEKATGSQQPAPAADDPSKNPDMIRAYDAYGREMFITKEKWRMEVLPGALTRARGSPDELYGLIVLALQDGFARDVLSAAEHLLKRDPVPARAAMILGIVYLKLDRLDDAQRVLEDFIKRHGEEGVVLTNLAKVHSARGDNARAESTLWHAVEVDPNQDNALGWYASIHRERGGKQAELEAFRRAAALPRSWRANLWIARDAVQRQDLATAMALYAECLARAPRPPPADLLMQLSGDLGQAGHLNQLVALTGPLFDAAVHGLWVGNNLIKANLDLGHTEDARRILNELYAQKRPDWQKQLEFWDTELAKARIRAGSDEITATLAISIMSIEGPLWMRDGSPFSVLQLPKTSDAPRIALFGSTALIRNPSDRPTVQLSDTPGRLSRALPLVLCEQIHLSTTATGIALMPWAQGKGFALFGKPYDDASLCDIVRKSEPLPGHVVGFLVDATQDAWALSFRLLRVSDAVLVATEHARAPLDNPWPAVKELSAALRRVLAQTIPLAGGEAPAWYSLPDGADGADYLLRLEQQLAVMSEYFLKDVGLSGEHSILDGALHLCARQPRNALVRMLFAQTLREMKKIRPAILPEYRQRTELLEREHPILGEVGALIKKAMAEAFAPVSNGQN